MMGILTRIISKNLPLKANSAPLGKSRKERLLLRAKEKFHSMEEVYGPKFLAPPKMITTKTS